MKGSFAAIVAGVGVFSTAAHAVDWSINSTISESVELNDNQFLRTTPAGTVGSYTSLSSVFTARTPTTRFDFTPDFSYKKYWGPGVEGSTLAQSMNEGAKLHFEKIGKIARDRDYVDASWRQSDLATSVLNELGLLTPTVGNIDTTTVQAGLDRNLSATDFLALSARSTSTDFQPSSAGTHFLNSGASANFRHQSNRLIALTASSDFTWLAFANATHTNIYMLQEMAGIDTQPFRGVTFNGSAGAAIVNTPAGTVTGLVYNALLSYQWLQSTQISFRAVQSVSPSILGSLQQLRSFDLTLRHTINKASSISASGDFSQSTVSGSESDFLSASTSYSYQLAREWTFQATYRFLHRTSKAATNSLLFDPITGVPTLVPLSSSSVANSNSVLLVLTHNFVTLPPGT